jgi:8-oxo-dGTP pyrophosphatase MutT (NUDIX family)
MLERLRQRLARYQSPTDTDASLRWAAVALIVTPDPDSLLLIRRAKRSGDPWGGHMGLPGGRQESEDADLVATAIRETYEEVGILLPREALAGALDDVVPRTPVLPPIGVRPFVFLLPERPALKTNQEVANTSWVTLSHLLTPGTRRPVQLEVAGQTRLVEAYYLTDTMVVWGMTERILTSLSEHLA